MNDATTVATEAAVVPSRGDSHGQAHKPRPEIAQLREADLQQKMLWTVPETAFMCRVGVRTVWRLMSDPKSDFPRPRRIGGRTLLVREQVLAYLTGEASR
jgi:predicted DNA-binding transcriptional regulator AlpA